MQNVVHAATRPLYLLVLAAAIFSGLMVANWLFAVGIATYVAVVVLSARDPATTAAAERSQRKTSMSRLTSPTFRALIEEIDRSQQAIERSVTQAQGALLALLQRITVQTRGLVDQAHGLADKGQVIEQYLVTMNYRQIQDQINQIDGRIATTSDSYTVQQLQETRAALVDRQNNARALETYIGRITAQLQNIDANLDNVLAETVRLRTADTVSADSTSNQVAERLRDLNTDMDAFQRVLDTALVQSGAQ